MNFIAGFLYLTLDKQEAYAFAVMKEVISKYNINHLFDQELPMLKLMFYQLDRLIAINLPDLHTHFKDEQVNSSYFCSPFFITIFTQVIQFQSDFKDAWKLQRVWDHFLCYGWKGVFKVTLLILKTYED